MIATRDMSIPELQFAAPAMQVALLVMGSLITIAFHATRELSRSDPLVKCQYHAPLGTFFRDTVSQPVLIRPSPWQTSVKTVSIIARHANQLRCA